jgi:hypothetical protein
MIQKIKRHVGLLANLGNSFIDKIYFFKELLYPQSKVATIPLGVPRVDRLKTM